MPTIKEDKAREHRIEMEIVVDAYNEIERAMGWYYCLQDKLNCNRSRPDPCKSLQNNEYMFCRSVIFKI
jgi:hypothetical protein